MAGRGLVHRPAVGLDVQRFGLACAELEKRHQRADGGRLVAYAPYYPGGWKDWPNISTPTTAAALTYMEAGISAVSTPPIVKATLSTSFGSSNAAWVLVGFDGTAFDTDTIHSNSANNDRLTCKTAGKYAFTSFVDFGVNATGIRALLVQKNSEATSDQADTGIVVGGATSAAFAGVTPRLTAPGLVDLAVNDYLACIFFQNSGGTLAVGTDSYFEMHRVG